MSETDEQIAQRRREADAAAQYQKFVDRWWQNKLDEAAAEARRDRELNPVGLRIW
jgi:hypothetical protein